MKCVQEFFRIDKKKKKFKQKKTSFFCEDVTFDLLNLISKIHHIWLIITNEYIINS